MDFADPLDALTATGLRLIWVEDFDERILLVDHDRIALVDHRISRHVAAHSLREALGLPCQCLFRRAS